MINLLAEAESYAEDLICDTRIFIHIFRNTIGILAQQWNFALGNYSVKPVSISEFTQ